MTCVSARVSGARPPWPAQGQDTGQAALFAIAAASPRRQGYGRHEKSRVGARAPRTSEAMLDEGPTAVAAMRFVGLDKGSATEGKACWTGRPKTMLRKARVRAGVPTLHARWGGVSASRLSGGLAAGFERSALVLNQAVSEPTGAAVPSAAPRGKGSIAQGPFSHIRTRTRWQRLAGESGAKAAPREQICEVFRNTAQGGCPTYSQRESGSKRVGERRKAEPAGTGWRRGIGGWPEPKAENFRQPLIRLLSQDRWKMFRGSCSALTARGFAAFFVGGYDVLQNRTPPPWAVAPVVCAFGFGVRPLSHAVFTAAACGVGIPVCECDRSRRCFRREVGSCRGSGEFCG